MYEALFAMQRMRAALQRSAYGSAGMRSIAMTPSAPEGGASASQVRLTFDRSRALEPIAALQ